MAVLTNGFSGDGCRPPFQPRQEPREDRLTPTPADSVLLVLTVRLPLLRRSNAKLAWNTQGAFCSAHCLRFDGHIDS